MSNPAAGRQMNLNARNFVVVLDPTGSTIPGDCFLGAFPGELRIQRGVRQLEHATRYTAVGARRIAAGFRNARAIEVA